LLVTFILVKIAKRIPEKWIEKLAIRKA